MRSPVRVLLLPCALSLLVVAGPAPAAAKPPVPKKATCPSGKVPAITGSGARARFALDAKGKVRCATAKRVTAKALPTPSATPGGQLGAVADQLRQTLAIRPEATARLERRIGAARARRLVAVALTSWRTRAASASAGRAASRAHTAATQSQTFTPADGAKGTISADFTTVDDGTSAGVRGSATIDGAFTRGGIDALAGKAGVSLPADVKGGRFTLELRFADLARSCPDAAGKVKGSLKASGRITLAVGTTSVTLGAEVEATYALTVGEDARWKTVDDVDVKTAFSIGGTGRGTETWRGHRSGTGFGHDGILGAGDVEQAITRDLSHVDAGSGGAFGPHGGFNFGSDRSVVWDLHSVENVQSLMATSVATLVLTAATVEYVRQVAAPRSERIWFDAEACLRLEGAAAAARLRAGQSTTVTTRNARAADGTPVPSTLTATGVAALEPAAAAMPAGASQDFTLTAPATTPARSSWRVVALSRAGKKTVSGELGGERGPYTVVLDGTIRLAVPQVDASAHVAGRVDLQPVSGSSPQSWTGTTPVVWSDIRTALKIDGCTVSATRFGGSWTFTIFDLGNDRIRVAVGSTFDAGIAYDLACAHGATGQNLPGPRPLTIPPSLELPAGGGVASLTGAFGSAGAGASSEGTLTVTPTTA
jgi:hypothetical protein